MFRLSGAAAFMKKRFPEMILCLFWLLSVFGTPLYASEKDSQKENFKNCATCHKGIEAIGPEHAFACVRCHLHPEDRNLALLDSHRRIVRNPSDPKTVRLFCLPCHREEISSLERSLHWTMAGVINQTRYLWGAQKTASPALYGIDAPLLPLPEPEIADTSKTTADLVDDFLRRRCLRCHLHSRGPGGPGLYRATGCAACHMPYHDDGRYRGEDEAVSKSKPGYPVRHVFTHFIPNDQCLHCHHQNHVGADYEGLFEHDYNDAFRSPLVRGRPIPETHGLNYHHLARDVHAEKGLLCIDCHTKKEIMGDGNLYSYQMEVPKRSCEACHGGFDRPLPDPTISGITKRSGGFVFLSKNKNQKHPLPLFDETSTSHHISAHRRVRCSACHGQWSYQDYGLSVMREKMIADYKWIDKTVQGDPAIEKELKRHSEKEVVGYPVSTDWVSGRINPGIWSLGWRFRRWSPMPLGVDQTGRFAVLRPRYQYLVSAVDRNGTVVLDSAIPERGDGSGRGWAFMPYVPHTIAPFGRACLSCHKNRLAAGLPPQDGNPTVDTRLMMPSPPAVKTMRLLNDEERKKLFEPGSAWQKERLKIFKRSQ